MNNAFRAFKAFGRLKVLLFQGVERAILAFVDGKI